MFAYSVKNKAKVKINLYGTGVARNFGWVGAQKWKNFVMLFW